MKRYALTVSLVEGNHELRGTFAVLLNGAPGLCCVGVFRTAEDAMERIPLEPPDIALIDIDLPALSGLNCVAGLKDRLPDLQILALTMYHQNDLIFNALRAGANGYLLKNTPGTELIAAVEQAHAGGAPMSMSIARKMIDYFQDRRPAVPPKNLTPRERRILELLGRGDHYREIGESMCISDSTVRAHLDSICHKLHDGSCAPATPKLPARA